MGLGIEEDDLLPKGPETQAGIFLEGLRSDAYSQAGEVGPSEEGWEPS